MTTVLVVGGSKGIGLETVKQALEAGHRVRVLARTADGIPVHHPALDKVSGDALDRSVVAGALNGVDVVIQTLGVTAGLDFILKPVRLFSKATRVLVEAMTEAGVRRLICVTGLGAGDSRGKGGFIYNTIVFPIVLKRAYDDKDVQERIIRNSSLDWIIARPGLLTDGAHTGAYQVLCDPRSWRAGAISRADVADFLVKQVDNDRYLHQTPLLIN